MFELFPARVTQSSRTGKIFGYVGNLETGVSYITLVEIYAKLLHVFPSNGVFKHFSYLLVESLCTTIHSLPVEPLMVISEKKKNVLRKLKKRRVQILASMFFLRKTS